MNTERPPCPLCGGLGFVQTDGVASECEACIAPTERAPARPPRSHRDRLAEQLRKADERFKASFTTEAAREVRDASRALLADFGIFAGGC